MGKIMEFLTKKEVLITIIILVVLIIGYLLYEKINKNLMIRKLHQLEIDINSMRSTPISYKLNKAVGLSRVNENVVERVEKAQAQFAEVTTHFDSLTLMLGNAEDSIFAGKQGEGRAALKEIDALYQSTNTSVISLNHELENLLEDEMRLRDDINNLKNEFRNIRQNYANHASALSLSTDSIEERIDEIELKFNSFEEWMFASEFSHAQEEYVSISDKINELKEALSILPSQIEKATGIVPHFIEEVTKLSAESQNKGVFLDHLEIDKNIEMISDSLNENISNIKQLKVLDNTESLDDSIKRLQQLQQQITKEEKAFDAVSGYKASIFSQQSMVSNELETLNTSLPELQKRFGFNQLSSKMPQYLESDQNLTKKSQSLQHKLENEKIPYTTLLVEFNEFNQDIIHLQSEVQEANRLIHSATQDESRAQNQLLKLSLLMNDIQTKIKSRNLPHISDTYQGDVTKANQMIYQIRRILDQNPLNINLLNSTVHETIDYIYRLYNNVNNLVGTVDMVENAIVYANKYRSSSPELDSELTRAEISFRNGEYTYALTTVIYAIEKFRPGAKYEELILQNSKSA